MVCAKTVRRRNKNFCRVPGLVPLCFCHILFLNLDSFDELPNCGRVLGIRWLNGKEIVVADAYLGIILINLQTSKLLYQIKFC